MIINKIFIWVTVDGHIDDPYHEVSWASYVGQMHFISGIGNRSMVVPAIIFRNFKNEKFFFRSNTCCSVEFLSERNTVYCRFIICLMIRDFY
jgi:hypothetical protein